LRPVDEPAAPCLLEEFPDLAQGQIVGRHGGLEEQAAAFHKDDPILRAGSPPSAPGSVQKSAMHEHQFDKRENQTFAAG
jgi:hypothetical protein